MQRTMYCKHTQRQMLVNGSETLWTQPNETLPFVTPFVYHPLLPCRGGHTVHAVVPQASELEAGSTKYHTLTHSHTHARTHAHTHTLHTGNG